MKLMLSVFVLLLIPFSSLAHDPLNINKDDHQIIYVNNEIPGEILKAYNDQVELVTELRLKVQELEQELYFTKERLTNLEQEVWDMPTNQLLKGPK